MEQFDLKLALIDFSSGQSWHGGDRSQFSRNFEQKQLTFKNDLIRQKNGLSLRPQLQKMTMILKSILRSTMTKNVFLASLRTSPISVEFEGSQTSQFSKYNLQVIFIGCVIRQGFSEFWRGNWFFAKWWLNHGSWLVFATSKCVVHFVAIANFMLHSSTRAETELGKIIIYSRRRNDAFFSSPPAKVNLEPAKEILTQCKGQALRTIN